MQSGSRNSPGPPDLWLKIIAVHYQSGNPWIQRRLIHPRFGKCPSDIVRLGSPADFHAQAPTEPTVRVCTQSAPPGPRPNRCRSRRDFDCKLLPPRRSLLSSIDPGYPFAAANIGKRNGTRRPTIGQTVAVAMHRPLADTGPTVHCSSRVRNNQLISESCGPSTRLRSLQNARKQQFP